MSGSISFSTIPADLRVPLFWAEFDNSRAGPSTVTQRALLIGQKTTATLPAELAYVPTADQVAELCGAGSQIARMMAAWRANDTVGEVWILPLADAGGGVKATKTVTMTGTSTAAGTIALYVAGKIVTVAVPSGTAASAVATAMAAAVTADTSLPVTAAAASAVVTLTAKNAGTAGNDIDVRHSYRGRAGGEALPAGITVAVAAGVTGSGDPDLTTLATMLADEPFDFIVMPWGTTTALDAFDALMNDTAGRWSYAKQIYGHVWTSARNTSANLLSLGAGRNGQHATILGVNASPSCPCQWAAASAAASAVALKADPARPLQTLAIRGVLAPVTGQRFTLTEQQSLLSSGIALPSFGVDGSASILRMVTTYRQNAFGAADQSYLDVETLFTLMAVIRRLKGVVTQKFARSKLADDGTRFGPGQPIVTPRGFKAELVAQYATMEAEGLVEDAEGFAEATIVLRNPNDVSRLDVLYAPNLVNGLRVLALLAQFRL
jgi:phage tail sheath gpL-like